MNSDERIFKILRKLHEHGWISLSEVGILLGYAHPNSIYQRQRSKSAIPTIKVGGINRVYEDDVLKVLRGHWDTTVGELILSLYARTKKTAIATEETGET